jgi:hypothetical protein
LEEHRNTRCGHLKERDDLIDLWVGERIILKLLLMKQAERACTGLIWLTIGTSAGLFEKCSDFSGTEISLISSELPHSR